MKPAPVFLSAKLGALVPLAFYTQEANEIHELLDAAGVPRTANGQPLSMSQRVEESLRMARIARQKD